MTINLTNMYQPLYRLTNKLLRNISTIERTYGQIESLHIPKKLELNLTKRNLIASSYASNRIEGNPLTLPEVTNLLLDDRVPVNRDEKEVVNYFSMLQNLSDFQSKQISVGLILEFHTKLMTGVDETAGIIRNVKVVVGKYKEEKGNVSLRVKHDPPHHDRKSIKKDLDELCIWINTNIDIPAVLLTGIFHHEFVYIHPFEDGNGRVCRLLTALLFIKHDYMINKYFVLDDYYDIDRQQYSDMLHSADSGDKTEWLEYYTDGVKFSLQGSLAKYREAITSLRIEEQPTPKEREVLKIIQEKHEVTSQMIVKLLKVSRQQAHALLRGLMEKGLLGKKGKTKSSYYFIK
ncbi:MAG: Fic family protein [Candidatus Gottesmanbacteria bacterium GW2011_GWA2_44_17]|uniref:Fic family protein n=3 Tax=Candidatus Gottesmaniibacteriota TaxID=1752720 RepID=A0A0G1HMG2_9BACT|nr:MAG: Fic family protein [Microgenomates group bacterium GW2011_GWC1_43_11]KKT38474.1 MAG: Fic family protein [Candidatus Gottesmanbacteria bacterium GW2011_GWB1_44_11c]KKT47788.1 MAG: Fic family protein [Candidatus Gottesmanbacteria bacterium GW2011_GWA2_44_17]